MVTIILSPDIRMRLRHVREWSGRLVALVLIMGCMMCGMRHEPVPVRPPLMYSTAAMLTATIGSSIPRRVVMRRLSARPTNGIMCLAQNLYFEANNEPIEGIEAVAATVFNRMQSTASQRTLCAVIYQPFQYSWTRDAANWNRRPPAAFVRQAAQLWIDRAILMHVYPVTHFHRVDIHPRWSTSLSYVGTFGQHKFYRMES